VFVAVDWPDNKSFYYQLLEHMTIERNYTVNNGQELEELHYKRSSCTLRPSVLDDTDVDQHRLIISRAASLVSILDLLMPFPLTVSFRYKT